jgi:hypothetical protein
MDLDGIKVRLRRLEALAGGLCREAVERQGGNDPLLYAERRAYLNAVRKAIAGLDSARVVLAHARQRPRRARPRPPAPGGRAAGELSGRETAPAPARRRMALALWRPLETRVPPVFILAVSVEARARAGG